MMKVTLLSNTENPEKIVAAAAKLCYSSKVDIDSLLSDLTPEKVDSFINRLRDLKHESPFEHASFTFGIEGVSRALSHQLVRSRLASFSQRSQRYCSEESFEYVIPESIKKNPAALDEFKHLMDKIKNSYGLLESLGVPQEDARAVLPNACATRLVMTMNVRELWHFFNTRCCTRAQLEIRTMANQMLAILKKQHPFLFKNSGAICDSLGYCPEGKMSCGKAPTLESIIDFYREKNKKTI